MARNVSMGRDEIPGAAAAKFPFPLTGFRFGPYNRSTRVSPTIKRRAATDQVSDLIASRLSVYLRCLTLLEAAQLVKGIEEAFGVSAAAATVPAARTRGWEAQIAIAQTDLPLSPGSSFQGAPPSPVL